jgi:hypothetical protein
MDWFERLTGFRETNYEETRSKFELDGERLRSRINGASFRIGDLELVSLQSLRERAKAARGVKGRLKAKLVHGDVRLLHRLPENAGALFQVASQFNLLEMVSPDVTPEQGVTRYQSDATQGPACAIAAGAATIYRNYFAPVGGKPGQTAERQFDGLADMGAALSGALKVAATDLWHMHNGYALAVRRGLEAINRYLRTLNAEEIDELRGKLCVGIHRDVEVTECESERRPLVSHAFCSALPVSYCPPFPSALWEPFAALVLEAAYEATMWAGVLNAQRGASNAVLLTLLGGGAFGNDSRWIYSAMRRALMLTTRYELDVKFVTFAAPSRELLRMADEFH